MSIATPATTRSTLLTRAGYLKVGTQDLSSPTLLSSAMITRTHASAWVITADVLFLGLDAIPLAPSGPGTLFHMALAGARIGHGVQAAHAASALIKAGRAAHVSCKIADFAASGGMPALKGDPYHPDSVENRIKPPYKVNPQHVRGPTFLRGKTPLPRDAEEVYRTSMRGSMKSWYGKGQQGWYRYFDDNTGFVHFSGIVTEQSVPNDIKQAFR